MSADLVERLRRAIDADHLRGCEGRKYHCSCRYDDRRDDVASKAADEIDRLRAAIAAAEARGEEWGYAQGIADAQGAPRAGPALSAVLAAITGKTELTANEITSAVAEFAPAVTTKEVYNAISYLKRSGRLQSFGYGRYAVLPASTGGKARPLSTPEKQTEAAPASIGEAG